ncbi:MAG: choice-of-anchor D domain-containing protein [Bacteroidota bacterium]
MQTFTRFFSLIMALAILAPSAWAQGGSKITPKIKDALLNNSAQGREFYIAIPPNEKPGYPTNAIEFYITSSKNTNVRVEAEGLGYNKSKPVEAMKITTYGAADGIGTDFEVRTPGVSPYAFKISADQPISVYVLNAKTNTSEGYLALPTSVWGKENINCSFYDFGEFSPWGGGFLVVASQNQTVITVKIKGKGFGRTTENNKIGDVVTRTLNKGDVYNMVGNGATVGSFDMTGTTITSNKPVGLISYHERVMIPAIAANNGRDHLSEMIPPTSAWGKNFVTGEYMRKGNGDLFRAVAKEAGTIVKGVWYDKATNQKIGAKTWVLNTPGQFEQSLYASESPGGQDVRGYSVWTSNKPILLMQYSYSANWDGDPIFDPFMIIVPPLEQYIQGTVFQTPASAAFTKNWFNILAVGDSTDGNHTLLKTLKLDGKFVYETDPKIMLQRIPSTNIYYLAKDVNPGAHRVESKTKFAGFIYGFSSFDSYGWPAAMALNKIDELDTNEPVLKIVQECGLFKINATELREGQINDNPRQVESGVGQVQIRDDESYNFQPDPTPATFENDPMLPRYDFTLQVVDLKKDAKAVFEVIDRAGNVALDSVIYIADKLSISPDPIDVGKVRVGTSLDFNVVLTNNGVAPVELKKVSMKLGSVFTFISGDQPTTLAPNEKRTLVVRYSPTAEYTTKALLFDQDSLIVETTCARFPWEVKGRGVMPKIKVGDFDAGSRGINEKACLENGLLITNYGTDDLTINTPTGYTAPFTLTNITPAFPLTLAPGDTVYLKEICFESPVVGDYTQNILFASNAMAGDSVSNWKGKTTNPGVNIGNYDWEERRVATSHDTVIKVTNTGNITVAVTDIKLKNTDNNFKIIDVKPYSTTLGPIALNPVGDGGTEEILIYVRFTPESLGAKNNSVVATYSDKVDKEIEGTLKGIGVLPVILANNIDFSNNCQDPTEVGKTDATPEVFTVKNTGDMDLTITRIELVQPVNGIFNWADPATATSLASISATSPLVLAPGDSRQYNLTFTPSAVGSATASIEINSDTARGTNAQQLTVYQVIGCGYAPGLEFTTINNTDLLCDNPVGTLTIKNTGGSIVNITSVPTIVDDPAFPGESNFFSIANGNDFPAQITPGNSRDIKVQFNPMTEKTYHAIVIAQTDNGPVSMSVVWKTTRVNAKFTLTNDSKLRLSDRFEVTINGESNTWNQVGAKSFEAQLIFNPNEMSYTGSITNVGLPAGWNTPTVSGPVTLPDGKHMVTVTGSGSTPIQKNGALVKLMMQTYLTPRQNYPMQLNMSLNERNKCVIIDTAGSSVNIEDCFVEGRAVKISGTQFMMQSISPNPATGGTIELTYSIGFTAYTRIELYNSLGEVVKVVVDGVQQEGDHTVRVDTQKLSSGVYQYRMVSGPFNSTKSMVITD